MCYDDQARPPQPPGNAGPARGEDVVLTAADGAQFAAFWAQPETPLSSARVLIYPDVRGLHQFYKELALRFAEIGYPALAIDYFGRTAGLTSRDESFEFMPHVQQIGYDTFTQDVEAALAFLRQSSSDVDVFVVGFCMGGSLTLMTGTNAALRLRGLIPFYAGLTRSFGDLGTVLDRARGVTAAVIGHFGGADQGIPLSAVEELDRQLDEAGVEHTLHIYPDAPHSFFDRRAEQYARESADAWQRTLAFIAANSTAPS